MQRVWLKDWDKKGEQQEMSLGSQESQRGEGDQLEEFRPYQS